MPCNCPLAFHFRILTWPSIPDPEGSRSWLGARMQDGSSRRGREGTPSLPAREGRGRQRAGSTSTPAGPTPRVAFGSRLTRRAPAARGERACAGAQTRISRGAHRQGKDAGTQGAAGPPLSLRSVAVRARPHRDPRLRVCLAVALLLPGGRQRLHRITALGTPRRGPLLPAAGDGGAAAPGHRS